MGRMESRLDGEEYRQLADRIVERGPVRTVRSYRHDCLGPSFRRDYPTPDFPSCSSRRYHSLQRITD